MKKILLLITLILLIAPNIEAGRSNGFCLNQSEEWFDPGKERKFMNWSVEGYTKCKELERMMGPIEIKYQGKEIRYFNTKELTYVNTEMIQEIPEFNVIAALGALAICGVGLFFIRKFK